MEKKVQTVIDVLGLTTTKETENASEKQVYNDWIAGFYDDWIFCYHPAERLLFIDCKNCELTHDEIIGRLMVDKDDTITTCASKVAYNVEFEEVMDAVSAIVSRDCYYGYVRIDWSDKEGVNKFMED